MSLAVKFKIIVLGDKGVGKSTVLNRYYHEENHENHKVIATTLMNSVTKVIDVAGKEIKLSIWDPSGEKGNREQIMQLLYNNVEAIIFMYDITSRDSFLSLNNWIKECEQHFQNYRDVPLMLVANKCDLKDHHDLEIVPECEGKEYARSKGLMFFMTSAIDTTVYPLDEVFMYLAGILKFSKMNIPNKVETEKAEPKQEKSRSSCSIS